MKNLLLRGMRNVHFVDEAVKGANLAQDNIGTIGIAVAGLVLVCGAIYRMFAKEKGTEMMVNALVGAVVIVVATQVIQWVVNIFA